MATASEQQARERAAGIVLPPVDTVDSSGYESIAESVRRSGAELEATDLHEMAAEVLRRKSVVAEREAASLAALWDALQDSLRDRRLERHRESVVEAERIPLRRQILSSLALGPRYPSQIAASLETPRETISRLLKTLRNDGLVAQADDPDDARRHVYRLTPAGEHALGQHLVFGATPDPPAPLEPNVKITFLEAALVEAIRLRRHVNRLEEAIQRIRVVVRESERLGAHKLELRARRELATTLRQDDNRDELHTELRKLTDIATGRASGFPRGLEVPASAHLSYELGRLPERLAGHGIDVRMRHLVTAANVYADLAERGVRGDDWDARRAWALFSIADGCREQTNIRLALAAANRAAILFSDVGDDYGLAHCLFLAGFSLRLRGDFAEAQAALQRAQTLAIEHQFARLQAMTLMQLGETRRCEGSLDDAAELLREACDRAHSLGAITTEAFALSALGATEFGRRHYAKALDLLSAAQGLFTTPVHREGLALTLRRLAIVRRRRASQGGRGEREEARRLILGARQRYETLQSPAGVAACLIESGRLTWASGRRPGQACQALLAHIRPLPNREMLERDPWVPDLLLHFARDVAHGELEEASEALVEGAHQRVTARDTGRWQFLHDLIDAPDRAAKDSADASSNEQQDDHEPDEMAGEPRRISGLDLVSV